MGHSGEQFLEDQEVRANRPASPGGIITASGNPEATLGIFKPNKADIAIFADSLRQKYLNGEIDPLAVMAKAKVAQKYIDAILGDGTKYNKGITEIREGARTTAESYGGKEFEFQGLTVKLTENGTRYDYSGCGDKVWEDLKEKFEKAKVALENRETLLKALKEPTEMLNPNSGEVFTAYPPVKSSTSGLSFGLK